MLLPSIQLGACLTFLCRAETSYAVLSLLMLIKVVQAAEAILPEAASHITKEGLFVTQNMFPAQIVRVAPCA